MCLFGLGEEMKSLWLPLLILAASPQFPIGVGWCWWWWWWGSRVTSQGLTLRM